MKCSFVNSVGAPQTSDSENANVNVTMNKRLKIYVAGPITPRGADVHDAPRLMWQNTERAINIGIELLRKGHNPYIPHLTYYLHLAMKPPFPKNYPYIWYELDNEWIRLCDAILYYAPSKGADAELELAKSLGLKVFMSLDEVPSVGETIDKPQEVS